MEPIALRDPEELGRLASSGDEVRAISDLFPEGQRTVLLRKDASIAALREALDRTERPLTALHLACHGRPDTARPGPPGLVLARGEVLDLLDVYTFRVPADLVVISSCGSARGRVIGGEGVLGLARAFFFAGCSRVVVSNWRVEDEATKRLMIAFYARMMKDGLPPAAALREAKLGMLKNGGAVAAPSRWAAFVLWGLP